MEIISNVEALRQHLRPARISGLSIALVPTMGNLHQGHMNLVHQAILENDIVVASIFVNPLQFGPDEDLLAYPKTLDQDIEKLRSAGCHVLFSPSREEIYGEDSGAQSMVHVPEITARFCGKSRPGHFDGVATVVTKLFNLVLPQRAYFGLKDYQQVLVIEQLVKDLNFDIEIKRVDIARDSKGLALSSRNNYLDNAELEYAAALQQTISKTAQSITTGNRDFSLLENEARNLLEANHFSVDYFAICNAENLEAATQSDSQLVILAAAYIGKHKTRLIDNMRVNLTAD